MATAPTADEMAPLLGGTGALDQPAAGDLGDNDPESEGGEFDAAAMAAVGTRAKAAALKDAITACLREQGLLKESASDESSEDDGAQPAGDAGY